MGSAQIGRHRKHELIDGNSKLKLARTLFSCNAVRLHISCAQSPRKVEKVSKFYFRSGNSICLLLKLGLENYLL